MSGDAVVRFAAAQALGSVAVHFAGAAFRNGRPIDAFAASAFAMFAAILFITGLQH